MNTIHLDLKDDVVALLRQRNQSAERAALELIVLELYHEGRLSGGRAAELLGLDRLAFMQYAGERGIPFSNITEDDWAAELAHIQTE